MGVLVIFVLFWLYTDIVGACACACACVSVSVGAGAGA